MRTNLKSLNRRQVELIVVLLLYVGAYIQFIGPAIGAVTGFDEPVTVVFNNTFTRDLPLNVRGLVMFVLGGVVVVGYMHLKAQIIGVEPREYWN